MNEALSILGLLAIVAAFIGAFVAVDVFTARAPGHPQSLSAYLWPLTVYLRTRFGIRGPGDPDEPSG